MQYDTPAIFLQWKYNKQNAKHAKQLREPLHETQNEKKNGRTRIRIDLINQVN